MMMMMMMMMPDAKHVLRFSLLIVMLMMSGSNAAFCNYGRNRRWAPAALVDLNLLFAEGSGEAVKRAKFYFWRATFSPILHPFELFCIAKVSDEQTLACSCVAQVQTI